MLTSGIGAFDLDPRALAQFLAVIDHGDVGRAAHALGVPTRTLAHGLQQLERDAGEPLVDRRARPLSLTPAGRRLAPCARRVLGAVERFRAVARGEGETLRVAHVANADTLSLVLESSQVTVVEAVAPEAQQLTDLLDQRLDFGLCTLTAPLPDGLDAIPVRVDPLLATGEPPYVVAQYGKAWPAHDALVSNCSEVAEYVSVPAGRELAALRRRAGDRSLLVPSSVDSTGVLTGIALTWHAVWRSGERHPGVRLLVDQALEQIWI